MDEKLSASEDATGAPLSNQILYYSVASRISSAELHHAIEEYWKKLPVDLLPIETRYIPYGDVLRLEPKFKRAGLTPEEAAVIVAVCPILVPFAEEGAKVLSKVALDTWNFIWPKRIVPYLERKYKGEFTQIEPPEEITRLEPPSR